MAELYHLGVDVEDVTSRALLLGPRLPGDDLLARWRSRPAGARREYVSHLVDRSGDRVLVVRVGVGAPPLAIALEELSRAGTRAVVMVARADRWSCAGDVLVPTGAVRSDGTSDQYAPLAFPAVPDARMRAAVHKKLGGAVRQGLVHSVDVVEQADTGPYVEATDMLSACLFVVAAARRVCAAAALVSPAATAATAADVVDAALQTLLTPPDIDGGPPR